MVYTDSNFNNHEELLPCPFCGNKEIKVHKHGWYPKGVNKQQTYQVRCTKCTMADKYWSVDTVKEAVDLWNTRY